MIRLSLPGFYVHFKFIKMFLEYYHEHPEFFYQDRIIDSFYDTDPSLLWQGGRMPNIKDYTSMNIILDEFDKYPEIKLRYTFTNCMLTEQIVNDYNCNHFVENFIREQDEVILNNPLLIRHFQQNYPKIPIIYSTTLGITDIDRINQLSEKNIYVLNYNYNNNNKYLSKLTHKNHIEILCAEPCDPNCPNRYKHYQAISKQILGQNDDTDMDCCPTGAEFRVFKEVMELPHAINLNRIKELESQGFQYFKISGRTCPPPQWLETILYYLALPQHREYVRQRLINDWW